MKLRRHRPDDTRHPKQLFVPVNEFLFQTFSVRPRYLGMAKSRTSQNRDRVLRLRDKEVRPCSHT